MKKKILIAVAVISVFVLCFSLTACKDKGDYVNAGIEVNVVIPDGAPALAIAKLLNSSEFNGYKITYEIVAGATDVAAKVASGNADIAIMPTNVAARLYSSANIKMVAANVFGLLYLVGTQDITSLNQLKEEKILCTGQGGTPDFVLQYILAQSGISGDDLNIQYISKGSDAIAALKEGTAKFALLGEPAATMAVSKANAKVLFDLQAEWKNLTGFDGYPQAGTFVTDEIFNNHSAFLKQFLQEMNANKSWIEDEANLNAVNDALKKYNSTNNFASAAVIKRCNIRYEDAFSVEESVKSYLEIMKSFNANFIGGNLPDKGFFAKVDLD